MERGLGSRDKSWLLQVFPRLGPKARRPQKPAPTEPYSWLFPTPSELPRHLLVTRLSPTLPLPQRLSHLLTSQSPLTPVLFPSLCISAP